MANQINIDELLAEGLKIADPSDKEHIELMYSDPFIEEKKDRDSRNPFERDYARVIHSASFRRLQGKMQLLGTQTSDYYRTRLTHSLEASQIGTEIATKIETTQGDKTVSKALVAMACLAHDIGNPPFGHFGEKALNVLMKDHGGFEGNAQTLRIVCTLEQKSEEYDGLNLTQASRIALVKYNVTAQQKQANDSLLDGKFLYNDQAQEVIGKNGVSAQSLECQIMELADDIAYACHDLEDSLKSGVLTLEDIIWSLEHKGRAVKEQFENIVKIARKLCGNSHGDIFHKSITSVLINIFVNDIGVVQLDKKDIVKKGTQFTKSLGMLTYAELLKQLKLTVYELLVRQPSVAEYEINGGIIVKQLFTMLVDNKYNYNYRLFPLEYQEMIFNSPVERQTSVCRAASDYISGMTDTFAMRLYKQHFGKELPVYHDCNWSEVLP
jgi:dGTPase